MVSSNLTEDDRALLREIGAHLSRIMHDEPAEPLEVERKDEIGILAIMVSRAGKVIQRGRERDAKHRRELERRIQELEEAYAKQEEMLGTIRALSAPIMNIHRGVLLAPIIGALDPGRAELILTSILTRITETRASVVILDVTGVSGLDPGVGHIVLRGLGAIKLLGARALLCGISPALAEFAVRRGIDVSAIHPHADLESALRTALRLVARRA
jgi:rsbT co-antagonist protein RsbR